MSSYNKNYLYPRFIHHKNKKEIKDPRLPPNFHWYVYREHNHDLLLRGLKTKEQFEQHWLMAGRRENRSYHWDNREYHNIYKTILVERLLPIQKRYNKIIMITQFYISPNEERNREIQKVIEENCANAAIDEIHLLNEQYFDLPVLKHPKIRQLNLGKRLSYYDAFFYSHANLDRKSIKIVCNNDMTYDSDDLECLRYYNFEPSPNMKKVMCLLRYEKTRDNNTYLSHTLVRNGKAFSQDTWIYCDINPSKHMDFHLGLLACDIRIAKVLEMHHYTPINPCLSIHSYHNHFSGFRKSTQATRVKGEYKHTDVILDEEIERIKEEIIYKNKKKGRDDQLEEINRGRIIYESNNEYWLLKDESDKVWKHIVNIYYMNQWKEYIEKNNKHIIYFVPNKYVSKIEIYKESTNITIRTLDEIISKKRENDQESIQEEYIAKSLTNIVFEDFTKSGNRAKLMENVIEQYNHFWKINLLCNENGIANQMKNINSLYWDDLEFVFEYDQIENKEWFNEIKQKQILVITDINKMKSDREEWNKWVECIREISRKYSIITTEKISDDIPSYIDYSLTYKEAILSFYNIPNIITFTEKNEYYLSCWNRNIYKQKQQIFIYSDYRNLESINHEIEYEAKTLNDIVEKELQDGNMNENIENLQDDETLKNIVKIYYFTDNVLENIEEIDG
jgi:hypothetical protein